MSRIEQQSTTLREILSAGTQSGPELQKRLELSQSALSRVIQYSQKDIMVLGAARSTRYGFKVSLSPKVGSEIPVYQVDTRGNASPYGTLITLAANEYGFRLHEETKTAFIDHLPPDLQNMRPEGFMGRAFAHRWSEELDLPSKLQDWTDKHVLVALAMRGEDCPGNLIIGKESAQRYMRQTQAEIEIISAEHREIEFDRLAEMSMSGELAGSSAGGEQPKFTALVETPDGLCRTIVKFASRKTDEGQRWSDLLVCEHLALNLLAREGITSAQTEIVQTEDWTFLQSIRFDREGTWGRHPMLSLQAIIAELAGYCETWTDSADELYALNCISEADAQLMRSLEGFGELIGNTDMHLGNLSLFPGGTGFELAPVYDMTPMAYRPKSGGLLPTNRLTLSDISLMAATEYIRTLSSEFWEAASQESLISESFRIICQENKIVLESLIDRPVMKF